MALTTTSATYHGGTGVSGGSGDGDDVKGSDSGNSGSGCGNDHDNMHQRESRSVVRINGDRYHQRCHGIS